MSVAKLKRVLLKTGMVSVLFTQAGVVLAHPALVSRWNSAALQAIRATKPGPPIAARALAITHTCIFDAWAAYDAKAQGTRLAGILRRPLAERTEQNKEKAISFAAWVCLADLFPSQKNSLDNLLLDLGYDPNEQPQEVRAPANIGKKAANAVLKFRHNDGANQLGNLNPAAGPYSDYTHYQAVNTPTEIVDPDHWQPLLMNGKIQQFIAPHWGRVKPYALTSGKQFRSVVKAPASYSKTPSLYRIQAKQILDYTAQLTDEKKVIAEYWADGPNSELPPGHWTLFADYVSKRDRNSLDEDVKMFFALTNAIFDASIACWDSKRFFDSVRPITAIQFLYAGQMVKSWNGLVDGGQWQPYQVTNFVTPPFPEYISGHSIFSTVGAETLRLLTGSDYFGYSVVFPKGASKVQPGIVPAQNITLYWPTFSDAAGEAGVSRRYGGIHFIDGDLESRKMGRLVARQAWLKTQQYFGKN